MSEKLYVIASIRHTTKNSYAVCLWGPNRSGYTPNIDEAGKYTEDTIQEFIGKKDDFPIDLEYAQSISVEREYNYTRWKLGHFILNDELFCNTFNIDKKNACSGKDTDKQYFRYKLLTN